MSFFLATIQPLLDILKPQNNQVFFTTPHLTLPLYLPTRKQYGTKVKSLLDHLRPKKEQEPPCRYPDRCKMSAAGASTSQQTQGESKGPYDLYELCLIYVSDDVYKVGFGGLNSCIDPDAGLCNYGPDFKATGEIDSPLRMVRNCQNQRKHKLRIKICDIDQDQLHNFDNAMLSFDEDNELFRSKQDKSPGNFMRAAWEHAWQKEALYQAQYIAGKEIFDTCQGISLPPGWPPAAGAATRARVLARLCGGMFWVFGEPDEPPEAIKFLDQRRVELHPDTKEVTLYPTKGETSDSGEGPSSS